MQVLCGGVSLCTLIDLQQAVLWGALFGFGRKLGTEHSRFSSGTEGVKTRKKIKYNAKV